MDMHLTFPLLSGISKVSLESLSYSIASLYLTTNAVVYVFQKDHISYLKVSLWGSLMGGGNLSLAILRLYTVIW